MNCIVSASLKHGSIGLGRVTLIDPPLNAVDTRPSHLPCSYSGRVKLNCARSNQSQAFMPSFIFLGACSVVLSPGKSPIILGFLFDSFFPENCTLSLLVSFFYQQQHKQQYYYHFPHSDMDVQEFIHPRAQDTHQQQTSSSAHYDNTFIESSSFPNANAATSPKLTAMSRPALPTILENGDAVVSSSSMASMNNVSQTFTTSATATSRQQQHQLLTPNIQQDNSSDGNDDMEEAVNPLLLMNRFDKRKSSPAVLGLPFGMGGSTTGISSSMSSSNAQAQQLGLQHHRNSIEAAMLLANFNRIPPVERTSPSDDKGKEIKREKNVCVCVCV